MKKVPRKLTFCSTLLNGKNYTRKYMPQQGNTRRTTLALPH